jgi:transcriptional regulator with XRE-family HTH domain
MPRGAPRLRAEDGKKNQIGERVRQRRSDLKLTQDQLNGRLVFVTYGQWNPSEQEILHIENGTRIVSDVEIIALGKALDCDPCWLLVGDK